MGETTALESESKVDEAMFRLRNGLLADGAAVAVVGAMMLGLDGQLASDEQVVVW
jgi:hypothetical protein